MEAECSRKKIESHNAFRKGLKDERYSGQHEARIDEESPWTSSLKHIFTADNNLSYYISIYALSSILRFRSWVFLVSMAIKRRVSYNRSDGIYKRFFLLTHVYSTFFCI